MNLLCQNFWQCSQTFNWHCKKFLKVFSEYKYLKLWMVNAEIKPLQRTTWMLLLLILARLISIQHSFSRWTMISEPKFAFVRCKCSTRPLNFAASWRHVVFDAPSFTCRMEDKLPPREEYDSLVENVHKMNRDYQELAQKAHLLEQMAFTRQACRKSPSISPDSAALRTFANSKPPPPPPPAPMASMVQERKCVDT